MKTRALVIAVAALAAACGTAKLPSEPVKPGLKGNPQLLAFRCVAPGCDESGTASFVVEGTRRLAIKRVVVDGDAAGEFTATPAQPVPLVLGPGSTLEVTVRYVPKGAPQAGAPKLLVTYADASPEESPDRAMPGEVKTPLVRRILGEALLTASPKALSFGAVPAGTSKTVDLQFRNEGSGTVTAELLGVDAGVKTVSLELPALAALGPDAGLVVPVRWSPTQSEVLKTTLSLFTSTSDEPLLVSVEGTSLPGPAATFEPADALDFGELAKGQTRILKVTLANLGGQSLRIGALTISDPSGAVKVKSPTLAQPVELQPLERLPIELEVKGLAGGDVRASLSASSATLPITGLITEPKLATTPGTIDFGTVPQGWVVKKAVELKNTGFGPLTVKNVGMVAGSSTMFTLSGVPALPAVLQKDQRLAFEVQLRAETMATLNGSLSVETDALPENFTQVQLKAVAGSCQAGCPITNGVPACSMGTCSVGSCNAGWYDTDKSAATGCECKEIGTDPGAFCATSVDLGTLKDTARGQVTFSGVLPVDGDVDVLRFFAEDVTEVLNGDDFNVKVRLDSADPNIQLCVYRKGGAHQTDCFFTEENCPANRSFQKGGGLGDDDADFIVKVQRAPGKGPTCTSYTVFVSNGR